MSEPEPGIEFPWHYFSDPTDSAIEAAARWIYSRFAPKAYRGFLEEGRGLLVGPFLTDEHKNPIGAKEFLRRREQGIRAGMTFIFAAADSQCFTAMLSSLALGPQLRDAIERYDPSRECVILLLANNAPYKARIVGTNRGIRGSRMGVRESDAVQ
ncbi:MAG TPA: hypothetical protein VIY49_27530 [Bryobacteraceae bacterium]